MDLNLTPLMNSDQENNQLFNAIKIKFEAKTASETVLLTPPKFNIPILKIPRGAALENTQTMQTNKSPQLKQFLIKHLQQQHTKNDLCRENKALVLPDLPSFTGDRTTVKFEVPVLEPQTKNTTTLSSLRTAFNKLQILENTYQDEIKSPATIDLTTALATKHETHQGTPPTRDLIKSGQKYDNVDFEIPFIDCDRHDVDKKKNIILPASNEYCVTDVSQLLLTHTLAKPSAIGRLLIKDGKKYLDPLPLKYFTSQFRQQQGKHNIKPFDFDTQSPDDIVLLALSKNQRRHYN